MVNEIKSESVEDFYKRVSAKIPGIDLSQVAVISSSEVDVLNAAPKPAVQEKNVVNPKSLNLK